MKKKFAILIYLIFTVFFLTNCTTTQPASTPQTITIKKYELTTKKINLKSNTMGFEWGGFSALVYKNTDSNGDMYFYSITDRGPNGIEFEKKGKTYRPFYMPDFSPSIVELKLSQAHQKLEITNIISLKNKKNIPFSGFPPQEPTSNNSIETPTDMNHHIIKKATSGLDTESLCVDFKNNFWVGEEYYPALANFSSEGQLLEMVKPSPVKNKLEKFQIKYAYNFRKINRGIEAMSCLKNKLYFLTQSPLDIRDEKNHKIKTPLMRLGIYNFETHIQEAEYLFELPNIKIDKFGDLTMINEHSFYAILQNGETGPSSQHNIVKIDFSNATNTLNSESELFETQSLSELKQKHQFAKLTQILNLAEYHYDSYDKVEGLTLIDDHTAALINDNDFGLDNDKINPERKTVMGILHF